MFDIASRLNATFYRILRRLSCLASCERRQASDCGNVAAAFLRAAADDWEFMTILFSDRGTWNRIAMLAGRVSRYIMISLISA